MYVFLFFSGMKERCPLDVCSFSLAFPILVSLYLHGKRICAILFES